jgi:hypothetical protein
MDGYLSKPLDKADLFMEIQKLLGGEAPQVPSAPEPIPVEGAAEAKSDAPASDRDLASLLAEMDFAPPRKSVG